MTELNSIDFFRAMKNVAETMQNNPETDFYRQDIERLGKAFGQAVYNFMAQNRYIIPTNSGCVPQNLQTLISLCETRIEQLAAAEKSKDLQDEANASAIKTARSAKTLAVWSLIIAGLAALGTIAQAVVLICR